MSQWDDEIAAMSKLQDALREDGAKLAPTPLFLLHCLMMNLGRIMPYPVLIQKMHDHTAGNVYNDSIRCSAKHVRKALRTAGWPFELECDYGLGYRLTAKSPHMTEIFRKGYQNAAMIQ
jgi:DNA-binding response OmpR family regulator